MNKITIETDKYRVTVETLDFDSNADELANIFYAAMLAMVFHPDTAAKVVNCEYGEYEYMRK
jgi:hypothetical protein